MSGWVDGLVLLVFFIIACYFGYKYGDEIVFDRRTDEEKKMDEAMKNRDLLTEEECIKQIIRYNSKLGLKTKDQHDVLMDAAFLRFFKKME